MDYVGVHCYRRHAGSRIKQYAWCICWPIVVKDNETRLFLSSSLIPSFWVHFMFLVFLLLVCVFVPLLTYFCWIFLLFLWLIAWKDSSVKWFVICWWGPWGTFSPTHSLIHLLYKYHYVCCSCCKFVLSLIRYCQCLYLVSLLKI